MKIKLILKYGIVGVLGTLLHFAVLVALVEWARMQPVWASAIGFIVVLLVSYLLNKYWTFQDSPSGWRPLVKYTVVSGFGLLLNSGIMYTAVDLLHWNYLIGQCFVVIAVPISNFIFNYYWTFRQTAHS
ncbi:GtrA family protein [Paenibacillus sp. RC67]|uniref:GtrA family protein n=1 Tax=Paenibacillus sp. RC67 TaxID=3039392 RepID=UPI0024AC9BD5|nr:GtrA family protein [Paenibacillus sp. RC67]